MRSKTWYPGALLACTVAVLFFLAYPLYVIQPFKAQSPGDLQRALAVIRIAPIATAALAVAGLALLALAWRRFRWWGRGACAVLALFCIAAAVLTRVNVFEKMFEPAGSPKFLSIAQAKLDGDDMLITVALNGVSHGYPIREIAYHHVINDWIGTVPIVATY